MPYECTCVAARRRCRPRLGLCTGRAAAGPHPHPAGFSLAGQAQPGQPVGMRPDLRSYAARQAGVVTCAQARRCGYAEAEIQRLVRNGAWVRVRRGAYVERVIWAAADANERHLLTARAVLLAVADSSVASHDTAAVAHGLPDWGLDLTQVSLTRPMPRTPRHQAGVRHHVAALPAGHAMVAGLPVTTPTRTALDVARSRGFDAGLVCADAALHAGADSAHLRRVAASMQEWPGASTSTAVAWAADGRTESPGESLTRVLLQSMGLVVEPQVSLPAAGARVDFRLRGQRVVVEFDGRTKYATAGGVADVRALWDEKRREDRIRELGYEVVRITWADLFGPRRAMTERRIRAAIARASKARRITV